LADKISSGLFSSTQDERRVRVCGGGGEGGKDAVEAAAAMTAVVATALLVNSRVGGWRS